MVVDPVLRVRRQRLRAVDARHVGLVLAEERGRLRAVRAGRAFEPVPRERVLGDDEGGAVAHDLRPLRRAVPAPRVPEPQGREDVERRLVGTVVLQLDPRQHRGRRLLRVGHVDRPVAVVVERAGVEQLELRILQAAAVVDELVVRERDLRVVVAPAQERVARQALEVPPVLLDVLAVVALRPGETEHPLLEDRVLAVPERERQAELVADVRDPGHAVLVPPIRARARLVVWERVPGIAALRVVLANGAPRTLAQVRTPLVPRVRGEEVVLGSARGLGETRVLRGAGALGCSAHSPSDPSGVREKTCAPHGSSDT